MDWCFDMSILLARVPVCTQGPMVLVSQASLAKYMCLHILPRSRLYRSLGREGQHAKHASACEVVRETLRRLIYSYVRFGCHDPHARRRLSFVASSLKLRFLTLATVFMEIFCCMEDF